MVERPGARLQDSVLRRSVLAAVEARLGDGGARRSDARLQDSVIRQGVLAVVEAGRRRSGPTRRSRTRCFGDPAAG